MERSKSTKENFDRALESHALPTLATYAADQSLLDRRRESFNIPPRPERLGPLYSAPNLGIIEHAGALDAVFAEENELYQTHEVRLRRTITIEDVMEYEKKPNENTNPNDECRLVGRAAARISIEADLESKRIMLFQDRNEYSDQTMEAVDSQGRGQLARYFVRRRWKRIGVWNKKWILTMHPKANWKWPWQKEKPEQDECGNLSLLSSAIEACGIMIPGDYGVLMKERARYQIPEENWTSGQGDEFIGCRPWFAFAVECMVERVRRDRVLDGQERWPTAPEDFIRRQWKQKGIWNDKWDFLEGHRDEPVVGWRWEREGEPATSDPRRSARIAERQRRAAAPAPRRRRPEPRGAVPTRTQPERAAKAKRRPNNTENQGAGQRSKGPAAKRRRRG